MSDKIKPTTLIDWVSSVKSRVLDLVEDEETVFSKKQFPILMQKIETDRIVVKKGFHDYSTNGAHRLDYLQWYAHKNSYEYLAYYILSALFHQKSCQISLVNKESDIRNIVIDGENTWNLLHCSGATVSFNEYSYWPDEISRRMSLFNPLPADCYPSFGLSNLDDCVVTDEQWTSRDTIYGFGTLQGTLNFVELLMNFSRPASAVNEFALEAEGGFRGVAPMSAESRLWLPGSLAWFAEWFENEEAH